MTGMLHCHQSAGGEARKLSVEPTRRSHPHYCLLGTLHLTMAMKLILAIGLLVIAAICVLEAIYFRRALFVLLIPFAVSVGTGISLCRRRPGLLWALIGISFFHLFLDAYATLIFAFFFLFKPLYIIMVLNWAFNTLHTDKTPSYYVQCASIFGALAVFFAYNLWQLKTTLRFQTYVEEQLNNGSATTGNTAGSASTTGSSDCGAKNGGGALKMGNSNGQQRAFVHHSSPPQCRILNEAPIVLLAKASQQGGCASPASTRSKHSTVVGGRIPQRHK